jgi:hypothetical protein
MNGKVAATTSGVTAQLDSTGVDQIDDSVGGLSGFTSETENNNQGGSSRSGNSSRGPAAAPFTKDLLQVNIQDVSFVVGNHMS